MNTIRGAMSIFLLAILTSAILGWRWAHVLPPAKLEAARLVLTGAALAAVVALIVIWSARPQKSH